jgi:hypothetical protein
MACSCTRQDQSLTYTNVQCYRFLLAVLHVDSLLGQRSIQKVKATLRTFKKGAQSLERAYSDAIERIESQLAGETSLAKQALSWITYARRLLKTQELCHALAIQSGEKALDPDAVYDIDDIVSVCAGLVTVDDESNIVRPVHYTTQEYFEQVLPKWIPTAQQDIASACVTYLSFDTFSAGYCAGYEALQRRLEENALLDYSARFWGEHAKPVQHDIASITLPLLRSDKLVASAVEAAPTQFQRNDTGWQTPNLLTGVHLAAVHDLERVINFAHRWQRRRWHPSTGF